MHVSVLPGMWEFTAIPTLMNVHQTHANMVEPAKMKLLPSDVSVFLGSWETTVRLI